MQHQTMNTELKVRICDSNQTKQIKVLIKKKIRRLRTIESSTITLVVNILWRDIAIWKRYHLNLNLKQYQTLKKMFLMIVDIHIEWESTYVFYWIILLKRIYFTFELALISENSTSIMSKGSIELLFCNIIFANDIEWVTEIIFFFNFFHLFNLCLNYILNLLLFHWLCRFNRISCGFWILPDSVHFNTN